MRKKIILEDMYIKLILLFPVFTILAGLISSLNKIFFAALVALQLIILLTKPILKSHVFIFLLALVLAIFSAIQTTEKLYNLNDIFYFPFMILYFCYIIKNQEAFFDGLNSNKHFISLTIILWHVLVLFSMCFSTSFERANGGVNFVSFAGSTFRLAPTALFIMCISYYLMKQHKQRYYFLFSALPMFCFLMGGTRTYLGIGCILFFIMLYNFLNSKKLFLFCLIPAILILVIFIYYGSIGDKIRLTLYNKNSYFDFWGTLTSGRTVFWKADLDNFFSQPVMNRLFGNGYNFVYNVNKKYFGNAIWAHNDFIQILLTYGYLGLIIYVFLIASLFKTIYKTTKNSKFLFLGYIMVWLLNAFFNMYYTYFCAMLSLPILIMADKQTQPKITQESEPQKIDHAKKYAVKRINKQVLFDA